MPEDSPKIPNYLHPDWTIGPDLPSPEYDLKLEKEIDAYVSWQTIRQEFGNVIVEFQLLESVLKDAISHLLNPHDHTIGHIVTALHPWSAAGRNRFLFCLALGSHEDDRAH
jgi:hypothetical protein